MRNTWELPEGRLEEIERATVAATEGPWEAHDGDIVADEKLWVTRTGRDDAAFIAASRTVVPELITAYRAAATRIEELEAMQQWQPIETAPKDEDNPTIVLCGGEIRTAIYVQFVGEIPSGSFQGRPYCNGWHCAVTGAYLDKQPTKWLQTLPQLEEA